MPLSVKLKTLRQSTGESLQQVATAVGGVTKAYLWGLEQGTSQNPGFELLQRIATHFKVPINYFYDEQFEPSRAEELRFFREYEGKLSAKDWAALRAVAEALRSRDA